MCNFGFCLGVGCENIWGTGDFDGGAFFVEGGGGACLKRSLVNVVCGRLMVIVGLLALLLFDGWHLLSCSWEQCKRYCVCTPRGLPFFLVGPDLTGFSPLFLYVLFSFCLGLNVTQGFGPCTVNVLFCSSPPPPHKFSLNNSLLVLPPVHAMRPYTIYIT